MEISDSLLCMFNAKIEAGASGATIEIPDRELGLGDVTEGEVYRIAVLEPVSSANDGAGLDGTPDRRGPIPEPPVEEGDTREVEIEDMGEQGDGIARVERGYIVFVPDTEIGERREIEIVDVRENFAFGKVIEERDYEL